MLKKINFVLILILSVNVVVSQPVPAPVVGDQLFPAHSVQVKGFIGEKLDDSYQNRILAQDVNRLVDAFRTRTEDHCWQGEFWGKWFTSAVLAYKYRPEPPLKAILEQAVSGLLSTQTPDDYIGNYATDKHLEQWDIWGRKYCMLGLLAYYDLTKDKNSLLAARKIADHLIKELADKKALIVLKGVHRGMAASSVLEPICLLYARTGEKRYLDFAEEIVRQWETPDGPQLISKATVNVGERFPIPKENWYGWEQGQKAYEMMSCYEGLLELYRLTGKDEYKDAVEKTWQNIRDTEINIVGSGSSMECWFGGKRKQTLPIQQYQETCVTATWIKLGQQLLRLTGEAKYANAIEQAYYNALLGAMKPDGSAWGYYSPLSGYKIEREDQCNMGTHCCNASGPRALFSLPLTTVMKRNDGLQVNFFVPGTYELSTLKEQTIRLVQTTDYPVQGKVSIKVEVPMSEEMTIRIRVPEWSKQTLLSVNGETVQGVKTGQYATINRKWVNGDEITLELDMRGRVIKLGEQPKNLAIVRGPIVLSRDSRLPGPVIDAWITPLADQDGYLNLELTEQNQGEFWMGFKAICKYEPPKKEGELQGPVTFCDYASAGNTYEEHSRFRVWFPQLLDPR